MDGYELSLTFAGLALLLVVIVFAFMAGEFTWPGTIAAAAVAILCCRRTTPAQSCRFTTIHDGEPSAATAPRARLYRPGRD